MCESQILMINQGANFELTIEPETLGVDYSGYFIEFIIGQVATYSTGTGHISISEKGAKVLIPVAETLLLDFTQKPFQVFFYVDNTKNDGFLAGSGIIQLNQKLLDA